MAENKKAGDTMKRDLQADLELCEKASPEKWTTEESRFCSNSECPQFKKLNIVAWPPNIEFISAAREGWPEAIRRAMEAEAENASLREDMDFLKQEYRDSEEPMTQDALELKARLKILQERDELRAENALLQTELESYHLLCEGYLATLKERDTKLSEAQAARELADAENASLKEELAQAEAALVEMQAAFNGVLEYACDRLEEVLTDPKNYIDHDFTDLSFTREYVAALAQSVIDDDVRNELQEAISAAKDAGERWKAMERVVEAAKEYRDKCNCFECIPKKVIEKVENMGDDDGWLCEKDCPVNKLDNALVAYEGVKGDEPSHNH